MALFRPYERTEKSKDSSDPTASADRLAKAAQQASSVETVAKAAPKATAKAAASASTSPADAASQVVDEQPKLPKGYTPKKGRPTPTRAEAEAARLERIHPTLSPKQRKKQASEARAKARIEAMDRAEQEPTKVLLRDYIDARWTATEFLIPVMLVLLAANMIFVRNFFITQIIAILVLIVFLTWLTNVVLVWRGFKKFARERLTNPRFTGLLMYANSRMMTIRRFRRPGPRIVRGAEI